MRRGLRALSVVPALGVFGWFVFASAQPQQQQATQAVQAPPPSAEPVYTQPLDSKDAWKVHIRDHGQPPPGMIAAKVSERAKTKSRAQFDKELAARINMPATKAALPWQPETYEAYLDELRRRHRVRYTRLWVSDFIDASSVSTALAVPGVIPHCSDHTWSYGREHTLRFTVTTKGRPREVQTDGPPALTRCAQEQLKKAKFLRGAVKKSKGRDGRVVVSFVVAHP